MLLSELYANCGQIIITVVECVAFCWEEEYFLYDPTGRT